MFYLVGGLFTLFFYAAYLAIVAMIWAVGILIGGISFLIASIYSYFLESKEQPGHSVKTQPKYYKQFEVKK